jgi:hypothetical protein
VLEPSAVASAHIVEADEVLVIPPNDGSLSRPSTIERSAFRQQITRLRDSSPPTCGRIGICLNA